MSARKGEVDGESEARIAPDPLAAVLPALAALGSIATIAAVIWVAQDGDPSRSRPRRKASVILRDLEADCVLLQDIFRRLGRSLKMFSGERAVFTSHFKFGLHGLKIAQSTYGMHQAIVADISRVLTSSSQNAFDTMCAIEDGAIDAPEVAVLPLWRLPGTTERAVDRPFEPQADGGNRADHRRALDGAGA